MSEVSTEKVEEQLDAMSIYGLGGARDLSPEMISALQTLSTGEVPSEAVKERPGKGDKVFYYVEHTWLSKQLREGLGMWWSYDVQEARVLDDGSAMAIVSLKVHLPLQNGEMFTNSVTEVGVWEDATGKMPHAMRVASAVSRGLARCAMRRFGIGEEFYHDDDGMSWKEAYRSLEKFATKRGMSKDDLNTMLIDEMQITRETVVDNFMAVWREIIRRTED